jgi:hypothetical protein
VIDQIREYKYDKYGNVIFKLHKNKDGVELLRETQEFYGEDEKKYSKMILKFDDGSLRGVYEKEFNKKGDLIKEIEKDRNNKVRKITKIEITTIISKYECLISSFGEIALLQFF